MLCVCTFPLSPFRTSKLPPAWTFDDGSDSCISLSIVNLVQDTKSTEETEMLQNFNVSLHRS